jgi:FtsP/CotA-like multicopper oxidase with cupredoxin domain
MPIVSATAFSRRRLIQAGAACALTALSEPVLARPVLGSDRPAGHDGLTTVLRPGAARVRMLGDEFPETEVWTYNRVEPGPVLRLRQATPFRATVENRLSEPTTVHWHGIRLPNAMDGVPGLTQKSIAPGERFDYAFTPPDAGTFWYHSHDDSLAQMGRGLAGALIVEEIDPPAVDRELLWTIQDWRLTRDAQIAPGFNNRMEAAMDGRVGNTVTINGRVPGSVRVRAGERIRLRLLNAAIARIMALRFEGHRPVVVALDGQPCEPHEPEDGRILLGPAMRADLMLDMEGEPGRSYQVVDEFYDGLAYRLVRLDYDGAAPLRSHPRDAPLRLPANPMPRPDLNTAIVHEIRLQGGMMSGMGMMGGGMMGMGGNAAWAINGQSMTGDGSAGMPPLFELARGRSCVVDIHNDTAWWHPMHLHGHSFQVLERDGMSVPHGVSGDTVLVRPRERVRVGFVADNPGDWMLHCHVMEHQVGGLMTIIRVA